MSGAERAPQAPVLSPETQAALARMSAHVQEALALLMEQERKRAEQQTHHAGAHERRAMSPQA